VIRPRRNLSKDQQNRTQSDQSTRRGMPKTELQNRCSTAELTRQTQSLRVYGGGIAVGSPPGATSRSGYHRLGTLANAALTVLGVYTFAFRSLQKLEIQRGLRSPARRLVCPALISRSADKCGSTARCRAAPAIRAPPPSRDAASIPSEHALRAMSGRRPPARMRCRSGARSSRFSAVPRFVRPHTRCAPATRPW
jgi:hypothetical protein